MQIQDKGLLGMLLAAIFLLGCSGTRPPGVGQGAGKLAPCPQTPNCVSTNADDRTHAIAPLEYQGPKEQAMEDLAAAIEAMPRTNIIKKSENYLYAQFTSAFWRFVDDVEFSFAPDSTIIHFRSASRLGKSDFGVNRDRMEGIRRRFRARQGQE